MLEECPGVVRLQSDTLEQCEGWRVVAEIM